jgi:hypothetical protein
MDAVNFIKPKRFFAFEDCVRIVTRLDFRAEIAPELLLFAGIYGRDKSRVACVHALPLFKSMSPLLRGRISAGVTPRPDRHTGLFPLPSTRMRAVS